MADRTHSYMLASLFNRSSRNLAGRQRRPGRAFAAAVCLIWLAAAYLPTAALAADQPCRCKDVTSNVTVGCFCGPKECLNACTSGHSCVCRASNTCTCASVSLTNSASTENVVKEIAAPKLAIPFNDLALSNARMLSVNGAMVLDIPWIFQYLVLLYRWCVGVGGMLAAVMMMIGGVQYMTAGGDMSKVSKGKERITNAVIGLAACLGSYLLLNTVNPGLISFQFLKMEAVKPAYYEEADFNDESLESSGMIRDPNAPKTAGAPAPTSNPSGPGTGMPKELPNSGDTALIDVKKACRDENPRNLVPCGQLCPKATKRAWEKLKKAAEMIESKGCGFKNIISCGRSGNGQLWGVTTPETVKGGKGGQWSSKCHIYYDCRVPMGAWCSTRPSLNVHETEDQACAWQASAKNKKCEFSAPKVADPNKRPFCDTAAVIHVDAFDLWVKDLATGKTCGSNVDCAKFRCYREFLNAWVSLGGCMLTNNNDIFGNKWENWHFAAVPGSGCPADPVSKFPANLRPMPQ